MADRAIEILPPHRADEATAVEHEHAALAVALTERHRLGDGLGRLDRARRLRHHVTCAQRLLDRPGQRGQQLRARIRQRPAEDGRRSLLVTASAEGGSRSGSVERRRTAANDAEDTPLHLHEQHQAATVGEVDDLVREVRDSLHVARPAERRHEHVQAVEVVRLQCVDERVEQLALVGGERRVEVALEQLLARAVPQAPRQCVRVALPRRRIRQRARVLVDAEREDRCLERRHGDFPLGEDADERRRQRPILGQDDVLRPRPVRRLAGVMVEHHFLHLRIERQRLELGQPAGARRLDDDQPPHRVQLETRRLDELQLLRVQPAQLPDIAVQRAGQADDGARIEVAHGEHRRERVEVGVRVRGNDCLGPHGTEIVPLRR